MAELERQGFACGHVPLPRAFDVRADGGPQVDGPEVSGGVFERASQGMAEVVLFGVVWGPVLHMRRTLWAGTCNV